MTPVVFPVGAEPGLGVVVYFDTCTQVKLHRWSAELRQLERLIVVPLH
jgi:hypothetical protein